MFYFPICVFLYFIVRGYQQAPPSLKKHARLFLIGYLLTEFVGAMLSQVTGILLLLIVGGCGTILMSVVIARHPRVLFILPFKALRLTVLDTDSGIPLFHHTWENAGQIGDEDLYAGMLQGVTLIIKESLNQGDVQEIKMSHATILVQRSPQYPLACIIVALKVSRSLRDALDLFAGKFYAQFSEGFANSNRVTQFDPASVLVAECFPFVPE